MLEKHIKRNIRAKINDWLTHIDDQSVVEIIKNNLIVTGGAVANLTRSDTPNDYDCYLKTKEAVLKVAEYYVNKWNESHKGQVNNIGNVIKAFVLDGENPSQEVLDYYGISDIDQSESRMLANISPDRVKIIIPSDGVVKEPEVLINDLDDVSAEILEKTKELYVPVFMSTNAITLSNKIQIIVRFYGSSEQVHENFDFMHTKGYYDYQFDAIYISKETYEAILNKRLIYSGSKYPICSLFRMRKFLNRGWVIGAGEILKMAFQIGDLNLHNVDVLEDQLIGVDTVYFEHFVNLLKEAQEKNQDLKLTTGYLISLVDKVF